MTETEKQFDIESVIGFDALYASMCKCRRGVTWKSSVASFCLNGIESVAKLEMQLKDGTYRPAPPKEFEITHPKRRLAVSITFRDRVYQRSLNDNVIYPMVTRSLIYDNMACQKGKGTDRARDRLACFLQRAYRRWGTDFYVLQIDVRGYYPHMRHDVAKAKLEKCLPAEAYGMAADILDGQYKGEIGFNPGSQMVQICGISVLDELDHFIKERLRIREYLRYMDDMILLLDSKEALQEHRMVIEASLEAIGFQAHPQKTRIYHISKGILFLGFRFHLSGTGEVYRLIDPRNVKAERRKLRKMSKKVERGEMQRLKVDSCYQAWRAHAEKGSTFKLLKRMDTYYKNLWR